MLKYTNFRWHDVTEILNTCSLGATRMYQTLELHRDPSGNVSNRMSFTKLADLANVARPMIYGARDELVDKGLIQCNRIKRGLYEFVLLKWRPDVVKLPQVDSQEEIQRDREFLESTGDLKR